MQKRLADWFGQPARLRFLPCDSWRSGVSEGDAAITWDHMAHSPTCSIAKARTLPGYEPGYSALAAVQESVRWLIETVKVPLPKGEGRR
jgi:hypothetical protein